MNAKDAYTLLETLLDGIDPVTGEMLPDEHVCQEPAVLRALHRALVALRNEADAADTANETEAADGRKSRYPRAGKPWTADDDKTLLEMYERGEPNYRIAKTLQRSSYAVFRRIISLGINRTGECPPEDEDADEQPLLPPWTLSDVQKLQRLHASGCSPEQIAADMHRPVESVRARMFYMGLTKEAPISLRPQE